MAAGDQGVSIDVPEVVVGEWGAPADKSICGSDDRIASTEREKASVARPASSRTA